MDKFTEARQTLGKAIYKQLKKYGDRFFVKLQFFSLTTGVGMYFYSTHYGENEKYTCEMGFRYNDGDGLMAVRIKTNGTDDAVSQRTTEEDLKLAMTFMPVVEKFLEVEAKRAGLGTE